MGKRIVIALGGNALGSTPYEQLALVTETAKPIVDLIERGQRGRHCARQRPAGRYDQSGHGHGRRGRRHQVRYALPPSAAP